MPYVRSDQAYIAVTVGGVSALDSSDVQFTALATAVPSGGWTSLSGGDITTDDVTTRPNAKSNVINLGGYPKRSDVTVTITYTTELDAIVQQLEPLAGKRSMSVSWTTLDADSNPNGPTNTITGILKNVTRPNFNATSTSDAALSLVMGANV